MSSVQSVVYRNYHGYLNIETTHQDEERFGEREDHSGHRSNGSISDPDNSPDESQ